MPRHERTCKQGVMQYWSYETYKSGEYACRSSFSSFAYWIPVFQALTVTVSPLGGVGHPCYTVALPSGRECTTHEHRGTGALGDRARALDRGGICTLVTHASLAVTATLDLLLPPVLSVKGPVIRVINYEAQQRRRGGLKAAPPSTPRPHHDDAGLCQQIKGDGRSKSEGSDWVFPDVSPSRCCSASRIPSPVWSPRW